MATTDRKEITMLDVATPKTAQTAAPPLSNEAMPAKPTESLLARWSRALPTLLILAVLGGIAVLGHHTRWKLPKFSLLTGNGEAVPDDWCAEHSVPESICVVCKPDLLPQGKPFGWCKKHGVHECPLCHPEVAQVAKAVKVTAADLERVQKATEFAERAVNNPKCKLQDRRLQFASEEAVKRAGIDVAPVWQAPMVEFVGSNGEIGYDQTYVARLSSRMPGTVRQVYKQVGDKVSEGEVLALVDAAEVGRAKGEFLQAFAQVDLKNRIWQSMQGAQGAIPGRTFQEAEAALQEARIRLLSAQQALVNLGLPIQADELKTLPTTKLAEYVQFLGLPESVTRGLDPRKTTTNLLPVTTPITGIVVAREVVAGEVVDSSKVLFVVADTRQMWLNLDVRIEDAKLLAIGQKVLFKPDGSKQELSGQITWISTAVNEKTRTVKLRAELANLDGRLRASTFGAGRVILREEPNAVVVPREALHHEGCCNVVFVRDKDYLKDDARKIFHVRKVVPGAKDDTNVEIIAGVLPGEVVATKGSGILRSELLKNHLGAG